ncbi:MAG TPA: YheU family protein [Myxococcota bacterium]|nr:YheU family protein [Myxococcota bacterium]
MKPLEVPPSSLSREVLIALVEEFVTRDGTDYGAIERSVDSKVADVLRQLDRGEVRIVFDPESETTTLVVAR